MLGREFIVTLDERSKKTKRIGVKRLLLSVLVIAGFLLVTELMVSDNRSFETTEITTPKSLETITTRAAPTLGIGRTFVSDRDGMILLYVPEGDFTMGSEAGQDDMKPVHIVYLDAFWIDQIEVTNAMFTSFSAQTGHITNAEESGGSYIYQDEAWKFVAGADWRHPLGPDSTIDEIGDHPVVHITWESANAYCIWAGRRLPTEAEWEKAASWDEVKSQKNLYPWGNDFDGTLLNFCDRNCPFSWANQEFDDGFAYTSPAGSYALGASSYGVYDMAGNAFEWVADLYGEAYYSDSPSRNPLGPTSGDYRIIRGGSWNYSREDHFQSAYRFGLAPGGSELSIGFRCAMSVTE